MRHRLAMRGWEMAIARLKEACKWCQERARKVLRVGKRSRTPSALADRQEPDTHGRYACGESAGALASRAAAFNSLALADPSTRLAATRRRLRRDTCRTSKLRLAELNGGFLVGRLRAAFPASLVVRPLRILRWRAGFRRRCSFTLRLCCGAGLSRLAGKAHGREQDQTQRDQTYLGIFIRASYESAGIHPCACRRSQAGCRRDNQPSAHQERR